MPKDRAEVREVLLCLGERMDVVYTIGWLERILGREDARVTRFREAAADLVAEPSVSEKTVKVAEPSGPVVTESSERVPKEVDRSTDWSFIGKPYWSSTVTDIECICWAGSWL